jgi:hypothetical protein
MAIVSRLIERARAVARSLACEEINGAHRCPTYLYRWELLNLLQGTLRVYLHKFVGDDWSTDLHDHPKRFWSIGLWGRYFEHRDDGSIREYRAPWIRTFPAEHRHRLTGPRPDSPCWTLVIVGAPVREWGFWHDGRFVWWRTYVAPGNQLADAAKSCGEV